MQCNEQYFAYVSKLLHARYRENFKNSFGCTRFIWKENMIEVFLVYQFKSSELMLFIENRCLEFCSKRPKIKPANMLMYTLLFLHELYFKFKV